VWRHPGKSTPEVILSHEANYPENYPRKTKSLVYVEMNNILSAIL
jgi:hypothetical protein